MSWRRDPMLPRVELKTDLSQATKAMVFAARLCYGQEHKATSEAEDLALLRKILDAGHWSILEHATAAFYFSNVSRNFTHQLVRHRHMSFAQQSFHYTVATDKDAPVSPDLPSGCAEELIRHAFKNSFQAYAELLRIGVSKEEARHVLPSGISTRIVATANLREWVQFVQTRLCSVNCFEIKEVAGQVMMQLRSALPYLRPVLGPKCLTGPCPEGKRSCGRPWKC